MALGWLLWRSTHNSGRVDRAWAFSVGTVGALAALAAYGGGHARFRPWLVALLGPAFMCWLLSRVSGVPPMEEHMLARHGQAYADYQRRTNAFFPGPAR